MAIANISVFVVQNCHATDSFSSAQGTAIYGLKQTKKQEFARQEEQSDLTSWYLNANKELILPLDIINKSYTGDPLEKEWMAIKKKSENFLKEFADQIPFNGFYLRGGGSQDIKDNESEYSIKLEWNLFKHGRYEMIKDFEKDKIQNQLRVLQLLETIYEKLFDHKQDSIENIKTRIQYLKAREMVDALEIIVHRRRVQLNHGYITIDDFDYIKNKYDQALLEKNLYTSDFRPSITESIYNLINCGEFLTLKNKAELEKEALDRSYSLRIQEKLIQRPNFKKSWFDDFTLNLFVEKSKDFDNEDHNAVGVNVKVPIHYYSKRDKNIEREKDLFKKQSDLIKLRISENIKNLSEIFKLHQYRIKKFSLEHNRVKKKINYELKRSQKPLEDLKHTPERSLEMLILEEINLRHEVLIGRLKILEILTKILEVTHANHPSELIVDLRNSCADPSAVPNGTLNQ